MTDLLTRPETRTEPAAPAAAAVGSGAGAPLGWVRLLVALTARTLLVAITAMALWGALPALIGWKPTTVVTGSMEPRISIGDIAVAMPTDADALALGRVILFDDPDHEGLLRLHRLVAFDDDGLLVTRGDANDADDSSHVQPSSVHGAAVLRVPWIGTPIVWFHEGRPLPALAVLAALGGLLALSHLDRDLRRRSEDADDEQDGGDGESGAAGRGRRRLGRGTLAAALVLAAVTGLATPAWAAWSVSTGNGTNTLRAAGYYSCSSAPVAENPLFYWKLDERSGTTAADSGSRGRPGSYVNGFTSTTAACGSGRAVTLDGSSQYLTQASTTAAAAPTTFTIEAWFRTGRGGMIANFGNLRTGGSSQHDRKVYVTEAGRVYFGVHPGQVQVISSDAGYADNRWHHVVATQSGNGMRLYLDGQQVASNSAVTSAENYNGFWRFGYDTQGGWPEQPDSGYLAGSLDNVAVYPTALTATQVRGHYDSRS